MARSEVPERRTASFCSIAHMSALALMLAAACTISPVAIAQDAASKKDVDTALIVAVDASESVDEERFRLQMEGIAQALEDPAVLGTFTGGTYGGILFSLVVWSDHSTIAVPWIRIGSKADADALAVKVRKLPRTAGEYTCLARMLRNLSQTLVPEVREKWSKYARIVIDVSGDGPDNCSNRPTLEGIREELSFNGVTINGLPIITDPDQLVGVTAYMAPGAAMEIRSERKYFPEALTLVDWYKQYVVSGAGGFVIPAAGYEDFGRAMRKKFVLEISQAIKVPWRTANTFERVAR